MSDATKAVFISYAREDGAAAKRLCEALREAGLEVWFDADELRGGDAWDASIKRQIRECALFVAVISAQTQEREEGYFRREWKLAVERTHDLAETAPFLVPVAIDETPEAGALVPEQFMRAHWTRLPRGLPTPQFVEEVKRQLARARRGGSTPPYGISSGATRSGMGQPRRKPSTLLIAAAGAVALVAVAGWWLTRKPVMPAAETSLRRAPAVSNNSIAVLPFTNTSDDKDGNAFFAEGIHEDILTHLSSISELRVVSRTSVMLYRDSHKPLRQIGEELGVAYILEGSVRRAGKTVRVTGQLINARTDEHVWARAYDRDLTDIFAIQSELAQEIATSLHGALSPREKVLLARRSTENFAAYELYLKARNEIRGSGPESGRGRFARQEPLLQKAVELDPKFAVGWAELAHIHSDLYANDTDHSPARLANAKAAIDHAVQLAPDLPEVIFSLGDYYYHCPRDYLSAIAQFEKLIRLRPNSAEGYAGLGFVLRRQGRWAEAVANFRQAITLDPGYVDILANLVTTLTSCRKYDEALAVQRRVVELLPGNSAEAFKLARLPFLARGSTREMESWLAGLPANESIFQRKTWALWRGDAAEFLRLDRLEPSDALNTVIMLAAQGGHEEARVRLERSPTQPRVILETQPENSTAWRLLSQSEAVLGHTEEALRGARKAMELEPESTEPWQGSLPSVALAFAHAWTGDKERALAEYARLLRVPVRAFPGEGLLQVEIMKRSPEYQPLRGDPRFEALLNDPKNNAPLF
jgi:TolB-like protein/cytochrome c-type biogenesis protein CcmH/NrfG